MGLEDGRCEGCENEERDGIREVHVGGMGQGPDRGGGKVGELGICGITDNGSRNLLVQIEMKRAPGRRNKTRLTVVSAWVTFLAFVGVAHGETMGCNRWLKA